MLSAARQTLLRAARAAPIAAPVVRVGIVFVPRAVHTARLAIPPAAQAAVGLFAARGAASGAAAGAAGGGGGGGGGGGRGAWEEPAKKSAKSLDSVLSTCMLMFVSKMKDLFEKVEGFNENASLSASNKALLSNKAIETDGQAAIKEFTACIKKNMGEVNAELAKHVTDKLTGMARDELMKQVGVNMDVVSTVYAAAGRRAGAAGGE